MTQQLFMIISLLTLATSLQANDCIPTPHRTTGTHYEPVTREATNISKGMVVRGQVLAMPDCKPVANAKVAHWQAGEDGRYSDALRAFLFTDHLGRFEFETEWPNLTPPHIHFIVTSQSFDTLETQWIGHERQNTIDVNLVLEESR